MLNELIVFVDEQGRPTGETGPKLASHHGNTKLHLAFSCYAFNERGELLVTQRALSKKVWPGVWTNSFCGHPMPGETTEAAIGRRAQDELGMTVKEVACVLPTYRYRTPPFQGIIENEFCPVFAARVSSPPRPNPEEVERFQWMSWAEYRRALIERDGEFSYWAKDQRPLMEGSAVLQPYVVGRH